MKRFQKKRIAIVIICLLTATYAFGQIKISEMIQNSEIASKTDNKLYFVDFWATWCVPCITAKEYLKVLQSQFPDEFYVISLSRENPLKVEKFLKKKPNKLAVAIDYVGETFKKHDVRVLPDGILFNANGDILWRGGAPDLKANMVSKYLKQSKTAIALEEFVDIIVPTDDATIEYMPKQAIEITSISNTESELEVTDNEAYLRVKGSLSSIISYLAKIYKNQIEVFPELNTNYEVYFKKPYTQNENLALKLISELGLNVDRRLIDGEAVSFTVETPRFWDTNQIVWGMNNPKFLIGDSQIKGDNVSLKDMAYQLAHVLDLPVIVPDDTSISLTLHDWDIHYKFYQLMQSDLADNYGIKAEKKVTTFPVYHIQKKAP